MEIKKLYFTLDEAAQLLSASIDAILQSAHDGRIALCVNPFGYQFSAIEYNDENNLTMKPIRFEGLKLSQATIRELIDNKGSLVLVREPKSIDEISLAPTLYSQNENSRTVLYSIDQEKMQLTLSDLVITADEIERLTQPAQANHSPADTVQNLQQQLNDARATIAELEKKPSKQQQREQALLFWGAGKGYVKGDTIPEMTREKMEAELQAVDRVLFSANFDDFWDNQKIFKLAKGRPKSNQ